MKASDLINDLQVMIENHGDLDVEDDQGAEVSLEYFPDETDGGPVFVLT